MTEDLKSVIVKMMASRIRRQNVRDRNKVMVIISMTIVMLAKNNACIDAIH